MQYSFDRQIIVPKIESEPRFELNSRQHLSTLRTTAASLLRLSWTIAGAFPVLLVTPMHTLTEDRDVCLVSQAWHSGTPPDASVDMSSQLWLIQSVCNLISAVTLCGSHCAKLLAEEHVLCVMYVSEMTIHKGYIRILYFSLIRGCPTILPVSDGCYICDVIILRFRFWTIVLMQPRIRQLFQNDTQFQCLPPRRGRGIAKSLHERKLCVRGDYCTMHM